MESLQEAQNIVAQTLVRLAKDDPSWSRFLTVSPALRYYHHKPKPTSDWYFWTTESVGKNGKRRYSSGIYKYLKSKKCRKLTNAKYHAKRRDAKARAYQLYSDTK